MNDEEFRDALRAAASVARPADVRVDPAAARRRGDVRARTRTAVTTSLAFSLVILAGFGAVFFAAHRSRPTTLGSDGLPVPTPSVSSSASPIPGEPVLFLHFERTSAVEVGQEQTLLLTGELGGEQNDIDIQWGDGQETGESGALATTGATCLTGQSQKINAGATHTYLHAGVFLVQATVTATCKSSAGAAFHVTVQPAPVIPTVVPPATSSPYVSARPTPTGSPRPIPSVSPSATAAATGSTHPTASATSSRAAPSATVSSAGTSSTPSESPSPSAATSTP